MRVNKIKLRMSLSNTEKAVRKINLFKNVVYAALSIFLFSCSSNLPVQRQLQNAKEELGINYSIVFIIHGDGDYQYHDTEGKEYEADIKALSGAIKVGEMNPLAEVFIFHQKPKRNFLLLFPLKDGEYYYYRNGQLISNELYWRDNTIPGIDTEIELYNSFAANKQLKMKRLFIYFGHEIPESGGMGYDASYPERTITVEKIANKIKSLISDSQIFDLLVLSTCYGGTPYTIGALTPFSRTIIASPDNLHLSYFDLNPLERLDLKLPDKDIFSFSKSFAQNAFNKLASEVQTSVSIAVYDVKQVSEFITSVQENYQQSLNNIKNKSNNASSIIEHCDCADLKEYNIPLISKGIEVYYRPARFGRLKYKLDHSGWECLKP